MNIPNLQKKHDTQNEAYVIAKTERFSTGIIESEWLALANERVDELLKTMKGLRKIDEADYVEALDLFVSFFDDIVLECVELTGRRAEIEEKIFALCKKVLVKPTDENARKPDDEHVTAKMIDNLAANPSAQTFGAITSAILDDTNPLRLGLSFYVNFCEKNPDLVDADSLNYLNNEAEVRVAFITGDDVAAFTAVEKLLRSPINCPEKYLLLSLNTFYQGLEEDAINALEIGLKAFPGNERLQNAKNAIQ